jgi:hypothetical protein
MKRLFRFVMVVVMLLSMATPVLAKESNSLINEETIQQIKKEDKQYKKEKKKNI